MLRVMNDCSAPARSPRQDDLQPRLSGTVEGVEFWLAPARGQRLRCLITDSALQSHFGAYHLPASWLAAFDQHRLDIARRALAASGRRDDMYVVLINDSAGRLRAAAGRRCS